VGQKTETAPAAAAAPKFKRPEIGDIVHYFDETRAQQYSKPGAGPYAALVTMHDVGGLVLQIFGPRGGNFYAENLRHKSELDPKDQARRKWWNWPHETPKAGGGRQTTDDGGQK
jgi:hypothetical protein